MGDWVTSNGVSLRVAVKTVGGRELPSVDFDNQTDAGFSVAPLKCSAWYEQSGRHEREWEESERSILVERGGKLTGFFTIDFDPPAGDKLLRVRLEYGPRPDETFTFVRQ